MPLKAEYIDISVPLSDELPVWPGGYGFHRQQLMHIANGDEANVTRLDYDVHSGTHIDAPYHFVEEGRFTDDIALTHFIGECQVLDFTGLNVITASDLDNKQLAENCTRILLKTGNSAEKWFAKPFNKNFTAISNDAAEWMVTKGVKLVGIDGPSIQKYQDSKDTHVTLLKNELVILEGLYLSGVAEGFYTLICLPVKAKACEGISARAILKPI